MNITTKVIISVLALLYSMNALNATHLSQTVTDVNVDAIIKHYGYSKEFIDNSYKKFIAILEMDEKKLKELFPNTTEANTKIINFHSSAIRRITTIVDLGIQDRLRNEIEDTPLNIATKYSKRASAEWLLKQKADAEGLLELACISGNIEIADLLLTYGKRLTIDRIKYWKNIKNKRITYLKKHKSISTLHSFYTKIAENALLILKRCEDALNADKDISTTR